MEQIFLDYMILLQWTKIEICMGQIIYWDSCYNHLDNDQILFQGSTCIFVSDNLREYDQIYDNRHTYVEIIPFIIILHTTGIVKYKMIMEKLRTKTRLKRLETLGTSPSYPKIDRNNAESIY